MSQSAMVKSTIAKIKAAGADGDDALRSLLGTSTIAYTGPDGREREIDLALLSAYCPVTIELEADDGERAVVRLEPPEPEDEMEAAFMRALAIPGRYVLRIRGGDA